MEGRDYPGDRLSILPDDLLLKILCCTKSYKDAVKCSVISKRYKYLYTNLPELHFVESEMVRDTRQQDQIGFTTQMQRKRDRKNLIVRTASFALFHHKAPVYNFFLEVEKELSLWQWCLQSVSYHPLRHLTLWSTKEYSILREFPFACDKLVTLDLWNVGWDQVSTNSNFSNLQQCNLGFTYYDSFWLDDFLPKCPILRHFAFEAPFCSPHFPFTFSSPSLQSINLCLLECMAHENVVDIRVQAPSLLKMTLDCWNFNPKVKVKVKVEATTLQEINVVYPKEVEEWFTCIQCHQIVWKDNVILEAAKWNTNRQLVVLAVQSAKRNGLLSLENPSQYATLKSLKISDFKIYPIKFWEMLSHLPLLESLTLCYCTFEEDDGYDISMEADADLEISDNSETEDLVEYTNMPYTVSNVTEIRIVIEKLPTAEGLLRGEKEMLQLFWENATYLRKLTVTLEVQGMLNKAKYLRFFRHLMSPGDSVHVINGSPSMENASPSMDFQLIKKSPKELATYS